MINSILCFAGDKSGKDVLALAEVLLSNLSRALSKSTSNVSWRGADTLARLQAAIVSLALLTPDSG